MCSGCTLRASAGIAPCALEVDGEVSRGSNDALRRFWCGPLDNSDSANFFWKNMFSGDTGCSTVSVIMTVGMQVMFRHG